MYDESHGLMELIRVAGRQHEAGDDTAGLGVDREVWRLAEETGDHFHGCMTAQMIGVMEPEMGDKLHWPLASPPRPANNLRGWRRVWSQAIALLPCPRRPT